MKIIEQSATILTDINTQQVYELLERAGRVCYASTPKGQPEEFIRKIINRKHLSVLEHFSVPCEVVCSRRVAQELTRHRLSSFSMESQRYVPYEELTFICPVWLDIQEIRQHWNTLERGKHILIAYQNWFNQCITTEINYKMLRDSGRSPQEVAEVLTNSIATKLIMTCNLRQWQHVFDLRAIGTTGKPDTNMQALMTDLLRQMHNKLPVIFEHQIQAVNQDKI